MPPELDILIERFRHAQDIAVHVMVNQLSLALPASNRAWVDYCIEHELHKVRERDGIGIYTHGFGIELKIDDLVIDFDWGDKGEPDGFDPWRLWNFRIDNCPELACSHADVQQWLKRAHDDGELTKDSYLYYDPKRRAL